MYVQARIIHAVDVYRCYHSVNHSKQHQHNMYDIVGAESEQMWPLPVTSIIIVIRYIRLYCLHVLMN